MALDGKQIKQSTVANDRLATASSTATADSVVLSNANAKIDVSFIPTDELANIRPWQASVTTAGTHQLQANRINKYARLSGGAMTLHLPASPEDGDIVELKEIGNSNNTVTLTTATGATDIEGVTSAADATSQLLTVAKLHLVYKWDAANSTWRLIALVNRSSGGAGGTTLAQDELVTLATSADGDAVSNNGLSVEPNQVAIILVYLNGVGLNQISYGGKTGSVYFSNDDGVTAAQRSAVTVGSKLYWNGSVAGFQLQSGWTIRVVYSV